ncbi:hypothetical protein GCM10009118_22500 [Wandonia haliotis]|uniref:Secretion system C-terminal sorting domain-containing protein n=1 Tax=Wandonia haliotis TaxID=574963 RepID=A0ABN1MR93_9FLAO
MKKGLLISMVLLGFYTNILTQEPAWNWATGTSIGGYEEIGNSIAVDDVGNVFVAGEFTSSSFTLGTITLTRNSANLADMFIAKYDNEGNILWAKNFGGSVNGTKPNSITVDATGNLYVGGWFDADTLRIENFALPNANLYQYDMFWAKFDPDGNAIWAKRAGGIKSEKLNGIALDDNGYLYFTGEYGSDFTLGNTDLVSNGFSDVFIAKGDSDGNIIWVRDAGETDLEIGHAISVDAAGNSIVTGVFRGATLQLGGITLTNSGSTDLFVAKYDTNGNVIWAKGAGGNEYETANSLHTDAAGNVYVTGSFSSSSVSFGAITLNQYYSDDMFLAKYDANGNVLWAKSVGGNGMDRGESVNVDSQGNAYVTGWYSSSSLSFGSTTLINGGGRNIFTSKWDANGNVLWVKSPFGNNYHTTRSAALDVNGNIHLTGVFNCATLSFGATTLTNAGVQNSGDLFVAKLGNATLGIPDAKEQGLFSVYPNPFSFSTTLKYGDGFNGMTLSLYTIEGRLVKQLGNISGTTYTLSGDNLQKGMYCIRLSKENKMIAEEKLIVTD